MTSAERVRRHRQRQQCGRAVWRIEVDEADVETMLVNLGLVPSHADDRACFEAGLANLIDDLSSGETRYAAFLLEQVESEE